MITNGVSFGCICIFSVCLSLCLRLYVFLNVQWWEVVDRSVKCDQDAFDVLYERYIEDAKIGKHWRGDVRAKVAVLARYIKVLGTGRILERRDQLLPRILNCYCLC